MKEQYKRLLAFLLTWMMCLSLMQGTVRAEVFVEPDEQITTDIEVESEKISDSEDDGSEEEQTQQSGSQTFTGIYINPLYRDVISEEDLVKPNHSESLLAEEECDTDEEQVSLSEEDYVSVEEAVAYLREQMKQRVETIIVKVVTDQKAGMPNKIMDAAMAHTGNPKEGDYLRWQYGGYSYTYWPDSYLGGNYYMTITYTMTYYTTAAQEAELDSAIASVKSSLGLNKASMSDYQKIKAIYDYLTKNITYDYEHLNDNGYKLKHTAYAAMINKTSVCQGYAVLFYRMTLECGIDARYVSGTGNGGAHGWNIVKLGNCYYNVDATWDAVYKDYRCFLKTDGNFEDHTRNAEYATTDFYAAYPMANVDYDTNHTHTYNAWTTVKTATCTQTGSRTRICSTCGNQETQTIAKTGHTIVTDAAVEATCTEKGKTEGSHCSVCGKVLEEQEVTPIDEGEHIWGEWQTISLPTIFEAEKQERYCIVCENAYETRDKGFKLKKTISVTQSSLMMQTKQKITDFQVVFANGDSVKSWESSNTKVVKVSGETDGTCIIAAQSKTGNAVITITLESGLKKTIQVKVQKGTVTATSLKLPFVKVTIKKGRTLTLKPVIRPITNQSKVTYSSSNKSIATVSSKGVVKGVKKGTAKITVRAGKKKVTCTVVVK